MLFILVMYRHIKKTVVGYVQIQRRHFPCPQQLWIPQVQSTLLLAFIHPDLPASSSLAFHALYSSPHSVMCIGISPVTHNLEPANHLAHCEETQYLSRDHATSNHLAAVGVSDKV